MLVLSRKVGERIQLGDQITVTLVKINGNMVRLGIDAPAEMSVMRQELTLSGAAVSSSDATKSMPLANVVVVARA